VAANLINTFHEGHFCPASPLGARALTDFPTGTGQSSLIRASLRLWRVDSSPGIGTADQITMYCLPSAMYVMGEPVCPSACTAPRPSQSLCHMQQRAYFAGRVGKGSALARNY
jgi:hypothetical protein